MKFFKHLLVVLKHKHYVFKYSCHFGIPFTGLFHDISKFSPAEFNRSVAFFAGDKSPTILERNKEHGFSYICAHHTGRNKHHWQYWIDYNLDNMIINRIPYRNSLEYVCDIMAASRVYHPKDFSLEIVYNYFSKHSEKYLMHPASKEFILTCISYLIQNKCRGIKKKESRKIYRDISDKYEPTMIIPINKEYFDKLSIKKC